MKKSTSLIALYMGLVLAFGSVACGSDDADNSGTPDASETTDVNNSPDVVDDATPGEDTADHDATPGEAAIAILYCFEDADGFTQEPTVVAQGFAEVSEATRPGADIPANGFKGNIDAGPSECPVSGEDDKSLTTNATKPDSKWPMEAEFDAASSAYFSFSFKAPPGTVQLQFDVQSSESGPTKLAVWESANDQVIAQDVATATAFTAYPMLPPAGEAFEFDIPASQSEPVEVRIYPYAASGEVGTFRLDNLTVLFSPAG